MLLSRLQHKKQKKEKVSSLTVIKDVQLMCSFLILTFVTIQRLKFNRAIK